MENGVMMQYFEWNLPDSGDLWVQLKNDAQHLRDMGITAVWIPPAYKGRNYFDEGYGIYDLYDLGEFNQKGAVRTKYGTKRELQEMISELHRYGISVYLDVVMNHKAGADYVEKFTVVEVDAENRNLVLSEPFEIEGLTKFEFFGRNGKYSDFKWNHTHFSGVDRDINTGRKGVFRIVNKSWSKGVDDENGNYDFLMFADLDFDNLEVTSEMIKWGVWIAEEFDLDGFRLDAVKHIKDTFIKDFLDAIRQKRGKDFYSVGEYWKRDISALCNYLETVDYSTDLFDVPLHYHLHFVSVQDKKYDLRELFAGTLVSAFPEYAVTFVDNHDTQSGSSLESEVKDWFKPAAYALILLMKRGYPCIFYGDYYGTSDEKPKHRETIDLLLDIKKRYAYGEEQVYFDEPHIGGIVRYGDASHPDSGLALILSVHGAGIKKMFIGKERHGEVWHDLTNTIPGTVEIDEDGNGLFPVADGKFSVWVKFSSDLFNA